MILKKPRISLQFEKLLIGTVASLCLKKGMSKLRAVRAGIAAQQWRQAAFVNTFVNGALAVRKFAVLSLAHIPKAANWVIMTARYSLKGPRPYMTPIETPFMITVCGLEELAGHADRQVSHVLSILDPEQPEPEAFGAYGEHARLELKFHDIIEDTPGFQAPQQEHVSKILAFGRDLLSDPENLRHLLVHCHAGISRSTASMTLLLAQAQPNLPASDVLAQVLHIRDKAWPNIRILEMGEKELGREGEFTSAVGAIYRYQLERRPEIKNFFLDGGRRREVEAALRPQS
jgi:predicted protein tyrosine phosphatase